MDESEHFAKIFEPVVAIMELGERDLEEELALVKGNFPTDKFNKMVMDVIGTLVQLHKGNYYLSIKFMLNQGLGSMCTLLSLITPPSQID